MARRVFHSFHYKPDVHRVAQVRNMGVIEGQQLLSSNAWEEVKKGWDLRKGLVGVYIHNLKDLSGNQSSKGANPFDGFNVDGTSLSSIVKAHNPPSTTSTYVYDHIKGNLEGWVEEAIRDRSNY